MAKSVFTAVVLGSVIFVAQGVAYANEVNLQGKVTGSFLCADCVDNLAGLSYTGSTFNVTTFGGSASLNSGVGSPNFNNLGSFTLGSGNITLLLGQKFALTIEFTVPTGVQQGGGGPPVFTATLFGLIGARAGKLAIDFDNTPHLLTFSNPDWAGAFNLKIIDDPLVLSFGLPNSNPTAAVHGAITWGTQTPVPEPTTLLLLGIGLIGMTAAKHTAGRPTQPE